MLSHDGCPIRRWEQYRGTQAEQGKDTSRQVSKKGNKENDGAKTRDDRRINKILIQGWKTKGADGGQRGKKKLRISLFTGAYNRNEYARMRLQLQVGVRRRYTLTPPKLLLNKE